MQEASVAKAHWIAASEYIPPRNDGFGACRVTLVVIAKAFVCDDCFYSFR